MLFRSFGTICGISPNTRTDLAINNMILNGFNRGKFWVSNPHIKRSFLAVSDCVDAIDNIISGKSFTSGLYNVKSFDCSMKEIAESISKVTNYSYDIVESEQTSYDFTLNISKINSEYGWHPKLDLKSLIREIHSNIGHIDECRRDSF